MSRPINFIYSSNTFVAILHLPTRCPWTSVLSPSPDCSSQIHTWGLYQTTPQTFSEPTFVRVARPCGGSTTLRFIPNQLPRSGRGSNPVHTSRDIDCWLEMGNEQWSPVLKTDVLLIYLSTVFNNQNYFGCWRALSLHCKQMQFCTR